MKTCKDCKWSKPDMAYADRVISFWPWKATEKVASDAAWKFAKCCNPKFRIDPAWELVTGVYTDDDLETCFQLRGERFNKASCGKDGSAWEPK